MNKIYSVRQINGYIKNMFTQDFLLNRVSVKGEVSNFRDQASGHVYFTLKDADASLSVVMFAGNRARGLKCRLKDGMTVIVTGNVDIYEAGGKVQLYAREISEEGEGELYRKFLELKARLDEMGMFDPSFKKPIPKYVKTVGIVTSASGAALHDIMQIANRRNPFVQLILAPAQVQGEAAPLSIVHAIELMDALHPDVMIVGRGGGSQEDLWCFNDERVARAIFDADTPVISAVGHEVDFTIADFVSDLRAPTPSAAAEIAVFDWNAYQEELSLKEQRLRELVSQKIEKYRFRLENQKMQLKLNHPAMRLETEKKQLQERKQRLFRDMELLIARYRERYGISAAKLEALSPLKKLTGGYGYVSKDGKPVRSAQELAPGDHFRVKMHDGTLYGTTEALED